ncbi:MAG: hypothetical protein DSZ08_00810 [Sulfurovum sp.]|nr:MAG: hypothetical protein DSZ08_00810 [Sulfurovum sp.]
MFNQAGLSLDQAPPISVVFKFFFLGALFGIGLGISLFFYQTSIFDTSTAGALSVTHLFTLGVMLSFMFGALFQMLPVIAGISITSPSKKSNLLLYPFMFGVIILILAFNLQYTFLYLLAGTLLAVSLFVIILPIFKKLRQVKNHTASSKGMGIALLSLSLTIIFALYLLLFLSGYVEGTYYTHIKISHYSFGLFGWIALLIISISFQVIEMFYVTPSYPLFVSKYMPLSLFILLFSSSLLGFYLPHIWIFTSMLLAFILSAYALLTLQRLKQKKRPLSDATVWFWRVGLSALLISMLCMVLGLFTHLPYVKTFSYIFFASFALSIVFAMFYKIVPFLTWFHLSSQGYFTAPMMHEVIHPKTAKNHLYIHITTIVTYLLSLFVSSFIFLAALFTILSFSWIAYQIIHAWKLYKQTQKTGEKFEMNKM